MEFIGNLTALLFILAVVIGVPTAVVERMRQRHRDKEHLIELQAWREAQDRAQQEHSRSYEDSLQSYKAGQAQARENHEAFIRFNERFVELREAQLKVAEANLEELRKTNSLLADLLAVRKGAKPE